MPHRISKYKQWENSMGELGSEINENAITDGFKHISSTVASSKSHSRIKTENAIIQMLQFSIGWDHALFVDTCISFIKCEKSEWAQVAWLHTVCRKAALRMLKSIFFVEMVFAWATWTMNTGSYSFSCEKCKHSNGSRKC